MIIKDIKAKLPVHSETAPNIKNHCSSNNTKLNIPHFSIIIIIINIISHRNLYIHKYTGSNQWGPKLECLHAEQFWMLPIISQIYAGTADSEVVHVALSPAEGDMQQVASKDISFLSHSL